MRNTLLQDTLETFWRAKQAGLNVYMIGRVETYDASTQTATVKPMIKKPVVLEGGAEEVESLPVIPGVPVAFPGGGGMRITFPVAAGDYCELHFCDRALGQWLAKGGEVDPIDRAMHAFKDAVAHVGIRPSASPWTGADESVITIGSDGGAAEFVATAARVVTELNKIKTAVAGAATFDLFKVAMGLVSFSDPASATVKIKG